MVTKCEAPRSPDVSLTGDLRHDHTAGTESHISWKDRQPRDQLRFGLGIMRKVGSDQEHTIGIVEFEHFR